MSNDRLIKVITDSKVEQPTALMLQNSFLPFYEKITKWSEKAKTLVVTNATQIREMKMAREARLALRDIRVEADKKRKELKEDSTRYGKAVQNVYNLIEELIVPAEKHLEAQEKFVELKEEARKAELKKVREEELLPYREFVAVNIYSELGEYNDEEYAKVLVECKESLEDQIAEEAQAELDRKAWEKEKITRQNKMFELGFKCDGSTFSIKGLVYSYEYLIQLAKEEFDKAYIVAKEAKDQLELEEQQALTRTTERKDQELGRVIVIPIDTPTYVPEIKPATGRVLNSSGSVAPKNHSFHCFYCGSRLSEIGLGGLECDDCLTVFIPFLDESGNQCLASQK